MFGGEDYSRCALSPCGRRRPATTFSCRQPVELSIGIEGSDRSPDQQTKKAHAGTFCVWRREGLLALRAFACGPPSPGDDVLLPAAARQSPDYWKSRVESFTPTSNEKAPMRGLVLCLAEREVPNLSMEFPHTPLAVGAPSATWPSLQYFPRGAPMVLRTMPGCAIIRDCPRQGRLLALRGRFASGHAEKHVATSLRTGWVPRFSE